MNKVIGVYVFLGLCMVSLAQTVVVPHGEGSVVFASPGGRWEKAVITDQLTGELGTVYSLEAESDEADRRTGRHPRIEFSCQQSGRVDRIWIQTGTTIANQSPNASDPSSGWLRVQSRIDDQKIKVWVAGIGENGSDLVIDKAMLHDLVAHRKLVIRFTSASGSTIVDRYLTEGLSIRSLKTDCSSIFPKK